MADPPGATPPQPQPQPTTTPAPTPAPVVPSLRLEAARIAGERVEGDWRFPEPGLVFGIEDGLWFIGHGHYRPRTARSAALHTGSIAATMLGEILLSTDSPLAGVGALIGGATLDSAAADVDRDAEARRPTR